MKKITLSIVVVIGIITFCNAANGFYYNVDTLVGGPIDNEWLTYGWTGQSDGTSIFSVQGRATNLGPVELKDVGVTWQFFYYPISYTELVPYTYDNFNNQWNKNSDWAKVYDISGQNDLISMNRSITNVPLEWEGATVAETDEVPVMWFSPVLYPGNSIEYSLDIHLNSQRNLAIVGFFISTVPEPATLLLLGLGGLVLRRKKH